MLEGCYKVVENINFETFLGVMGVPDDRIEAMIAATKQVISMTMNAAFLID